MDGHSDDSALADIVCFSHLRWDFVYQRPQHLMSRFARVRRVSFIEEPVFEQASTPHLRVSQREGGLKIVVPVLVEGTALGEGIAQQQRMLADYVEKHCGAMPTMWFQTPMALPIAPTELAGAVIYDCMDELTAFDGAPPSMIFNEKQLLGRADLVFTGGRALYDSKRHKHPAVHCFPSGIDRAHFVRAREQLSGHSRPGGPSWPSEPRIGFSGVIDERLDIALLAALADLRPRFQFIMVGPVVKIDEETLPRRENIHYLGMRPYDELPEIMAEWEVAIMPFAHNAATKFISPTKTPEYLAAGLPVVSTSIHDVVQQYGDAGLVRIADDAASFVAAIDEARVSRNDPVRLAAVDSALDMVSWDSIWARMASLERLTRVAVHDKEDPRGSVASDA